MHTIGNRPPCRTAKASRTEGFSTDEHLLGTESAFQTPQQPGRDGDRITDIGHYVQRPLARTCAKRLNEAASTPYRAQTAPGALPVEP
jgi:hypothetical protein